MPLLLLSLLTDVESTWIPAVEFPKTFCCARTSPTLAEPTVGSSKWTWMRWLQSYSNSRLFGIHGIFGTLGVNGEMQITNGCRSFWVLPRSRTRWKYDTLIAAVLGVGKSGSWNSKAKKHRFENLWLQPFCHVWYRNFPNSTWDTWDRKGLRLFAWSCERILTVAKLLCTIVQGGARPAGRKTPHQRGSWGKIITFRKETNILMCDPCGDMRWTMSLLNGASPERLKHQTWSND